MKAKISNNLIPTELIKIPVDGFIPEQAVLKAVRPVYLKDANGKKTDVLEAVRYDCVNPETFDTFTIKVPEKPPIISQEALNDADVVTMVSIPIDKVVIKPFEMSYGKVKVTIVAPFLELIN